MQERGQHYSQQRGHYDRGVANKFREIFGFKPRTLQAEIAHPPQTVDDRGFIYVKHRPQTR